MAKQPTRILTVGGGSGGHVTPVVAIIEELAKANEGLEVRFWCDRRFLPLANQLLKTSSIPVKSRSITAGKLRRYHGISIWRQLLDIPTVLRNLIDMGLIIVGFMQSLVLLSLWRPNVVFCKGGFVCLPVGYAAALLRIPIVLHDSDTRPGLTNRLLAPKARFIATGAPLEYYNYPIKKTVYTGVPVNKDLQPSDTKQRRELKKKLHLPLELPLTVVIGGGLGAKPINEALLAIGPDLLKKSSVVHICGSLQYASLKGKVPSSPNYILKDFVGHGLTELLAASDVLVTRAGATALAEAAAVGAATIIIPNDQLVGGHQTTNAAVYKQKQAAVVLEQTLMTREPDVLLKHIVTILEDTKLRRALAQNIRTLHKNGAAKQLAQLILKAAG